MPQLLLDPCKHASNPDCEGERGALCNGAPTVEVTWRSMKEDNRFCALRMPEHCVDHLSRSAMRAYKSLDLGPFGRWQGDWIGAE